MPEKPQKITMRKTARDVAKLIHDKICVCGKVSRCEGYEIAPIFRYLIPALESFAQEAVREQIEKDAKIADGMGSPNTARAIRQQGQEGKDKPTSG